MNAIQFARQILTRRRKPGSSRAKNSAGQEADASVEPPESAEKPRNMLCTTDATGETGVKDGYLQYLENGLWVRVDLKEGITSVGSSNNADCSLDSELVQNRHAEFTREWGADGTKYYVRDTSSGAGTYLNGERIPDNERKPLTPGCEIRLADVRMNFFRRPTVELMEKLGTARLGVK